MDPLFKQFASVDLKADGPDGPSGEVSAMFSTFGNVDSDGDVIVREAFTDGQQVAMVSHHRWDQIVGKGAVAVADEGAVFNGRFFIETETGREAHAVVKAMGDLQEWSFGFLITEAETGDAAQAEGANRIIKGLELLEVSPVLIGANRETRTLAVKGQSLEKHAETVLETVRAFAERVGHAAELRASKGGVLSPARVADLEQIFNVLKQATDVTESTLVELRRPDVAEAAAAAAAVAEWEFIQARGAPR